MDQIPGQPATSVRDDDALIRAVRIALVVYLSPVILVVLAIGGLATLAGRLRAIGSSKAETTRPAFHAKHSHLATLQRSARVNSPS